MPERLRAMKIYYRMLAQQQPFPQFGGRRRKKGSNFRSNYNSRGRNPSLWKFIPPKLYSIVEKYSVNIANPFNDNLFEQEFQSSSNTF